MSITHSATSVVVRRIIGGIIVLVGLAGLGLGLCGVLWLQGAADKLEKDVVRGMDFGLEGLQVVSDTLGILAQTMGDTSAVLDAARASAYQTAEGLEAILPAVQELADVTAYELPRNLEAIQDAMPAIESASGAIDTTLRTLASFQWSATIPVVNYELGFGLGIEYDPVTPLNESVAQVRTALAGIPSHLTGIQADLLRTHHELGEQASSIEQVGDSLISIDQDLRDASRVLEEVRDLVSRATDQARQVRWYARDRIRTGRLVLSGILVLLALSQLAPLYLGCTLLWSRPELARERLRPAPPEGNHGRQDLPSAEG